MGIANFLTSQEVATVLGVTDGRVRQFVTEGRLKPKKVGSQLFFSRPAVERFAQQKRITGRPKKKF